MLAALDHLACRLLAWLLDRVEDWLGKRRISGHKAVRHFRVARDGEVRDCDG